MMRPHFSISTAALGAALALAGCSGSVTSAARTAGLLPDAAAKRGAAVTQRAPIYIFTAVPKQQNVERIDVFNDTDSFTSFPTKEQPISPPDMIGGAIDYQGNLFASQFSSTTPQNNGVTEYSAYGKSVERTISLPNVLVGGLGADAFGTLYVLEAGQSPRAKLLEFATGATTPERSFSVGPAGSYPSMAVGVDGTVAIVNAGTSAGTVTAKVFAPGKTSPAYSFTYAGGNPVVAYDKSGNFYTSFNTGSSMGVYVYAPNATTPSLTLTTGAASPLVLTFDASNNLYVGNADGTVGVFAQGASSPSYVIPAPFAGTQVEGLAIDPWGNLFASYYKSTSTVEAVYLAGSSTIAAQRNTYGGTTILAGIIVN